MPKTKDQKRAEAVQRGKISFAAKHQYGAHRRFDSEDEYLDLFRPKREIVTSEHNLIYDENGYLRKTLPDQESHLDLDCIGVSPL